MTVARLDVAVLVLFRDDRLSGECLTGRCGCRRLLSDDQLAGRRRAHDDRVGYERMHSALCESERDRLSQIVGQAGKRRHAARNGDGGRPLERAAVNKGATVTTVLLSPVSRLPY